MAAASPSLNAKAADVCMAGLCTQDLHSGQRPQSHHQDLKAQDESSGGLSCAWPAANIVAKHCSRGALCKPHRRIARKAHIACRGPALHGGYSFVQGTSNPDLLGSASAKTGFCCLRVELRWTDPAGAVVPAGASSPLNDSACIRGKWSSNCSSGLS